MRITRRSCGTFASLRAPQLKYKARIMLKLPYIALVVCICHMSIAQQVSGNNNFLIKKIESGLGYPTEGDERLKEVYGNHAYNVVILHPKIIKGPHFSVPYFWVNPEGDEQNFDYHSLISLKPHMGVLSWYSANRGYFFAEADKDQKGPVRGFFLEDGFDNWDNGSSGLIFMHDGKASNAWRWVYIRDAKKKKGSYKITSTDQADQIMPNDLIKRIAPILDHAEIQADAWSWF